MTIPVMLAFDFTRVMTLPGSGFLYGNFAHLGAQVLASDAQFDTLNFDRIYHDGSTGQDGAAIREARMSEVVVPTAVSTQFLKAILCRTTHDAATLRHALAGVAVPAPILVPQSSAIFQKRELYLTELYSDGQSIHLAVAYPHHGNIAGTQIRVHSEEGDYLHSIDRAKAVLPQPTTQSPHTVWTIEIEGGLAYKAPIPWSAGLV